MKVALGHPVRDGAWGGGNRFAKALVEALTGRGDAVVFALDDADIDLIVITDPRPRNPYLAFTPAQVLAYLGRNPRAVVVHRINECDERKGTRSMNARLRLANTLADHTVFIASWLSGLDVWRREGPWSVILNGGDEALFTAEGGAGWDGVEPLRLVTHHWGGHRMKGFDVYAAIDRMLAEPAWRGRLALSYVGNLPQGFAFANARHAAPLSGAELAAELRRHHVYVTASVNEPAGMHHIEGALSGLPLLYRRSGALPEYCEGFGESFAGPADFAEALSRMMAAYPRWRAALAGYPHTAARMVDSYLALFDGLVARREDVVARRRPWRHPLARLLVRVPW